MHFVRSIKRESTPSFIVPFQMGVCLCVSLMICFIFFLLNFAQNVPLQPAFVESSCWLLQTIFSHFQAICSKKELNSECVWIGMRACAMCRNGKVKMKYKDTGTCLLFGIRSLFPSVWVCRLLCTCIAITAEWCDCKCVNCRKCGADAMKWAREVQMTFSLHLIIQTD